MVSLKSLFSSAMSCAETPKTLTIKAIAFRGLPSSAASAALCIVSGDDGSLLPLKHRGFAHNNNAPICHHWVNFHCTENLADGDFRAIKVSQIKITGFR